MVLDHFSERHALWKCNKYHRLLLLRWGESYIYDSIENTRVEPRQIVVESRRRWSYAIADGISNWDIQHGVWNYSKTREQASCKCTTSNKILPNCWLEFLFMLQSQSVETLIHEAYIKFGESISTHKIEELRNKHRRKTVHQFEIETENIIVKQYKDNGFVKNFIYFYCCESFRRALKSIQCFSQSRSVTFQQHFFLLQVLWNRRTANAALNPAWWKIMSEKEFDEIYWGNRHTNRIQQKGNLGNVRAKCNEHKRSVQQTRFIQDWFWDVQAIAEWTNWMGQVSLYRFVGKVISSEWLKRNVAKIAFINEVFQLFSS